MSISLLDILFSLILAGCIGLSAHKRLSGLFIGVGGALMLRPILGLAGVNDFIALLAALLVGAILAVLARSLAPKLSFNATIFKALGALGGLVFGVALILALAVSFPLDKQPQGNYHFFHQSGPRFLANEAQKSQIMKMGRYALFYKLYDGTDNAIPEDVNWAMVGFINRFFVVHLPWDS